MAEKTLDTLFHDTLKDIYYAERNILKALPKMQRGAQAPELKQAFETHKAETETHVERLQQVFEIIGKRAQGETAPLSMGSSRKAKSSLGVQGHTGPRCRPDCRGPGGRALRDHPLRHPEAVAEVLGMADAAKLLTPRCRKRRRRMKR